MTVGTTRHQRLADRLLTAARTLEQAADDPLIPTDATALSVARDLRECYAEVKDLSTLIDVMELTVRALPSRSRR